MQLLGRLAEGIYVATSMCFSWSFFYGAQEIFAGFNAFEGNVELVAVVNALVLSLVSMGMIIPLDWLRDQDWTDEKCDLAIQSIMDSLGLLIGFSWEQTFDTSVDAIAEKSDDSDIAFVNVHTTKMALTAFCTCLLLPAWYWYILPFIVGKGWDPLYPVKFAAANAKQMLEDVEAGKVSGEKAAEKLGKLAGMKEFAEQISGHADVGETKKRESFSQGGGEGGKSEPLLAASSKVPADEVRALKSQVMALQTDLKKEKEKSSQAQAMLNDTLEKMMGSMKQMHQTVTRIEGSA